MNHHYTKRFLSVSTVRSFVKNKSKQLAYYVRFFLQHKIPYSELDLFFWDTMEEWVQVKKGKHLPYEKNRASVLACITSNTLLASAQVD